MCPEAALSSLRFRSQPESRPPVLRPEAGPRPSVSRSGSAGKPLALHRASAVPLSVPALVARQAQNEHDVNDENNAPQEQRPCSPDVIRAVKKVAVRSAELTR